MAEYAPLAALKTSCEKAPSSYIWDELMELALALIRMKSDHQGGADRMLVLYNTDEKFFLPPPIQRAVGERLRAEGIRFEAIYFVSPHLVALRRPGRRRLWPGVCRVT